MRFLADGSVKVGDKPGHWTVMDVSMANRANDYLTKCKCVCGSISLIRRKPLVRGTSTSCGCRGIFPGCVLGGFTLISTSQPIRGKSRYGLWRCAHGIEFESRITLEGPRRSLCPCDRSERMKEVNVKHGESPHSVRTGTYNSWRSMRQRCNDPNNPAYKDYGGRGIKVCKRWDNYRSFKKDMGPRPPSTSLDRIRNDADYKPSNCRWATKEQQSRNRRNIPKFLYKGLRLSMAEWAERLNCSRNSLWSAKYRFGSYKKALSWAAARDKKLARPPA